MRTQRATKPGTFTITKQTTLVANLAGVRRIDKSYCQSVPFGSISYALNHQIVTKAIQLPSCALSNMLFPGRSFNFKILKNKHGILWGPLTKLRGCFSTKRFCLITLFPRQTFQDATHRARIFAQFLFRGFFRLNSASCFSNSFSFFRKLFSGNNKSILLSRCNQSISNTKINTNWSDCFRVFYFKSDTNRSFPVQSNIKGINARGIREIGLECFRYFKSYFFSAVNRRNRNLTAFGKRSVTPSFPDQKQSSFSSKNERSGCWSFVGFCRSVCPSYQSNSRAFKLRCKLRIYGIIHRFVQSKSIFCFSAIKTIFRNPFLISVEFLNRLEKIVRLFKSNRYSSLYQHARILPLNKNINQVTWGPRFLSALKDGVPARA